MNKSAIFSAAHKMAKGAIRNGKFNGNYRSALSWSLRTAYANEKASNAKGNVFGILLENASLAFSGKAIPTALYNAKQEAKKAAHGFYNANGELVTTSIREANKLRSNSTRLIQVNQYGVSVF